MRICILIILLFLSRTFFAQEVLNEYKYVIVNSQYEFQNESNQYQLNDLMVFELKKRGFSVFKTNERQPLDKNIGTCNSLVLDAEESGSLERKIIFNFKNCDGNIIYSTAQGKGKYKDKKRGYYNAVREAMKSLDSFTYEYKPSVKRELTSVSEKPLKNNKEEEITNVEKSTSALQKDLDQKLPTKDSKDVYENLSASLFTKIELNGSEVVLYNKNTKVGYGIQTAAGVYLMVFNNLNKGIGYTQGRFFIYEYLENGQLKEEKFEQP